MINLNRFYAELNVPVLWRTGKLVSGFSRIGLILTRQIYAMFIFSASFAIAASVENLPTAESEFNSQYHNRRKILEPISVAQNYLWPQFGKRNSKILILDGSENYFLSYLIPIAKYSRISNVCLSSIVVLTDRFEDAELIYDNISNTWSQKEDTLNLNSVQNTFSVISATELLEEQTFASKKETNWRDNVIRIVYALTHDFLYHGLRNYKCVIFDVKQVSEDMKSFIDRSEEVLSNAQILTFCRKFNKQLLKMSNFEISTKVENVLSLTVITEPRNACLVSPTRHIMYMVDGMTKHWYDYMKEVIQCTECNVAIFCSSDKDVHMLEEFFTSMCITSSVVPSTVSISDACRIASQFSALSDRCNIMIINDEAVIAPDNTLQYENENLITIFEKVHAIQRVINFSIPPCEEALANRIWTMRDNFNQKATSRKAELLMFNCYYFVPMSLRSDVELKHLKDIISYIKLFKNESHATVKSVEEFYKL